MTVKRNVLVIGAILLGAAFGLVVEVAFAQTSTDITAPANITLNSPGLSEWQTTCINDNCAMTAQIGETAIRVFQDGVREARKPIKPLPTAQWVRASYRPVQKEELPAENYMILARDIGIQDTPPIMEARLLDAISKVGLGVYDFNRVDTFLYNQALSMGTDVRWVWKPLRRKDVENLTTGNFERTGLVSATVYAKPVPQTALSHVAALMKHVPELLPLISDFEVVKPDPFLAVSTLELLRHEVIYVVYHRDEPGFTDQPSKRF